MKGGRCALGVAALLLLAGCGGKGETASPATRAASEATETTGPSAAEAKWLKKSNTTRLLAGVVTKARNFSRNKRVSFDISAIGGGPGECRQTLQKAGPPPTTRLAKVYRLTRNACIQIENAGNQMITYTLTKKNGEQTVHEANPAAAAKSMKRARTLAARAQAALAPVTGTTP